jgi:hypothetical protein
MSVSEFATEIGGGYYMDSNGVITRKRPEDRPVYPLPGGKLPVKPETIKKTLNDIAIALPDESKKKEYKEFRTKLGRLGVPDYMIKFLGTIGQVAGTLAKVVGVVGFTVDVAKLVGLFQDGPDALEVLIKKRFDQMEDLVRALEMQHRLDYITERRDKIIRALDDVCEYIEEVQKFKPNPARLEDLHQKVDLVRGSAYEAVLDLTNETTWLATFNENNYQTVWPWLTGVLNTEPSGGAPMPAVMPPQNTSRFDHRLMMLQVPFAVMGFLNVIKSITPEYRSTGEFDESLRRLADNVSRLAEKMRAENLARTIYQASAFDYKLTKDQILGGWFMAPQPDPEKVFAAVGAMDLCTHTDAFFQLPNVAQQQMLDYNAGKKAGIDFHWPLPARLAAEQQPMSPDVLYRIDNPAEIAQEANGLSELDYANLLVSSGYLTLAQTAALLRQLSSEPDRSETVSGETLLRRLPRKAVATTVKSDPILLTGVIESAARQEPQDFSARAYISVQPIQRNRPLEYRIMLRAFIDGTRDTPYEAYYSTAYEPDPAHPGFQRMRTSTYPAWVAGEFELAAGTSPEEPIEKAGEASFQAYTYDWFIPVHEPFFVEMDLARTELVDQLAALGWTKNVEAALGKQDGNQGQNDSDFSNMTITSGASPLFSSKIFSSEIANSDFFWEDGRETWEGEKRNRRLEPVRVEYTLRWRGNQLYVNLRNNQDDRNYLIYLVVEEKLASGQVLHTAYPVPVVGQLTYVPESFFEAEAKARAKLANVLKDFARRYSLSHEVGPEDPVVGGVRPGDFVTSAGLRQLYERAQRLQPELLNSVLEDKGQAEADTATSA